MLTRDNALIIAFVLLLFAAAFAIALLRPEKPIDWDAPATDLDDTDDTHTCEIPPIIWSDAIPPGSWVCAALVDDLPGGICGWPITADLGCPSHGAPVRGVA